MNPKPGAVAPTETPRRRWRAGGILAVAALALAATLATTLPAHAAADPANRVGGIAEVGSITGRPNLLVADAACPGADAADGWRVLASRTDGSVLRRINNNGLSYTAAAADPAQPIRVARSTPTVAWNEVVAPDAAEVVVYLVCLKGGATSTADPGNDEIRATDKYFSSTLVKGPVDLQKNPTWVVKADEPAPVKQTPTVSLVGSPENDGSVELTATVKKEDGSAATNATGQVRFDQTVGGTATGTVTVADGVAEWTTETLGANIDFAFTATYLAGGDIGYNDSAASAPVTGKTVEEPQPPQSTPIEVTIPAAQTGLKFTVTPGAITLGAPVLENDSWVSTGELGTVKVEDGRAVRPAWSLVGSVTDLTTTIAPANTIDGKWLGWTPVAVGEGNKGLAGGTVEPGESDGLKTGKALATGAANLENGETNVGATLKLAAPGSSAAGTYSATLTLTLSND